MVLHDRKRRNDIARLVRGHKSQSQITSSHSMRLVIEYTPMVSSLLANTRNLRQFLSNTSVVLCWQKKDLMLGIYQVLQYAIFEKKSQ